MNLDELQQAFEREGDLVAVEPVDPASIRRRTTVVRIRRMSVAAVALIVLTTSVVFASGAGRKDGPTVDVAASDRRTARLTIVTTTRAGMDGRPRPEGTETMEGIFDFGNDVSSYSKSGGFDAFGTPGESAAQVIQRGPERWTEISNALGRQIGTKAHWKHEPNTEPVVGSTFDPYDAAATVQSQGEQMAEEGVETIDGVSTTRYRVTPAARESTPTSAPPAGQDGGLIRTKSHTGEATIWVDDAGRLRRRRETSHSEYETKSGERGFLDTESTIDVVEFGVDPSGIEVPEKDVIEIFEYLQLINAFYTENRQDCRGTFRFSHRGDGSIEGNCSPLESTTTSATPN